MVVVVVFCWFCCITYTIDDDDENDSLDRRIICFVFKYLMLSARHIAFNYQAVDHLSKTDDVNDAYYASIMTIF